jgi:cyclic pyranopterin phosphate synthase
MPAGLAQWDRSRIIPTEELLSKLQERYGLSREGKGKGGGPSIDYSAPDLRGQIGFISSVTKPSCSQCNRLRVTAEGRLRPCLFSEAEFDLKSALRGDAPEENVRRVIIEAVKGKPEGHFIQDAGEQTGKPMAQIGG